MEYVTCKECNYWEGKVIDIKVGEHMGKQNLGKCILLTTIQSRNNSRNYPFIPFFIIGVEDECRVMTNGNFGCVEGKYKYKNGNI